MAYLNTSAPSNIGSTFFNIIASTGKAVRTAFKAVGHAMIVNSTAQQRLDAVARLQAKTDEELAALNIKRDQIVHHVFRDIFWY